MKNKFLLILSLFIFVNNYYIVAQYNVYSKSIEISSVLFEYKSNTLNPAEGYNFISNFFDSSAHFGTDIFNLNKDYTNKKIKNIYIYKGNFGKTIKIQKDSTFLYFNFYSNNVAELIFRFHSIADNNWYQKNISIQRDGYVVPLCYTLSNIEAGKKYRFSPDTTEKIQLIDSIRLEFIPLTNTIPSTLIFSCIKIFNLSEKRININYPFFRKMQKNYKTNSFQNSLIESENLPFIISGPEIYGTLGQSNGIIYIEPYDSIDTKKIIIDIFDEIFAHYPFYKEKSIDKADIQIRYKKIKILNSNLFFDSLKYLVRSFDDPHFFIPDQEISDNKTMEPVKIYQLNDQYVVAAIFDTLLNHNLSLGDTVLKIDSSPIQRILDSISVNYKGKNKIEKSLSKILKRDRNSFADLSYVHNGETKNIRLVYNKKLIIPENFVPKHCGYKKEDGNLYIKLNTFDEEAFYAIYSLRPLIEKANGLIIDLRNNPGGDGSIACKILAMFIKSPAIAFNTIIPNSNIKESTVIKPMYSIRKKLNIVVLGNNLTTCAAEMFIILMRKYCNAIFIGDSETAGALASRFSLLLPGKIIINTNALYRNTYPGIECIEGKGIEPDIYVYKSDIKDLYPYNDKVLQTAKRYLICQ
jgi:C-terminal processing protease CtpA/Prc